MNILITAATKLELKPLLNTLKVNWFNGNFFEGFKKGSVNIDFQITGIGLVHTSYFLTKVINKKKYDFVMNAGIAGSFNQSLSIGEVVLVEQEEFGDLGIENANEFETIFESGLMKMNEFPFENGKLKCLFPDFLKFNHIKKVNGLTSNTAHGNNEKIERLIKKFNTDIETMEGAAFFYVCLMEKVSFVEIRSISNYVESRDKSKWNIPLALNNLSNSISQLIKQIDSSIS